MTDRIRVESVAMVFESRCSERGETEKRTSVLCVVVRSGLSSCCVS